MGYLGTTLTQVFIHARGVDVSLRDVTIAQMGNEASGNDVTHRKRAVDFGNFEES